MLNHPINQQELLCYVDVPDAIQRLRGNRKVYRVLLQSFLGNRAFEHLQEALGSGQLFVAKAAAHGIHGVAANLSLPALEQDAAKLEAQLEGGVLDQVTYHLFVEDFNKTQSYVRLVLEELESGAGPS